MVVVGAGAEFTVRSGPEHARRRQVPLGLGYALSIHRCQVTPTPKLFLAHMSIIDGE